MGTAAPVSKTVEFSTAQPDETYSAGVRLGRILNSGDVVLLGGPLGAGKTVVVKGIAEGLGVRASITSPTFVLLRELDGPTPLRHLDLYRLDQVQEVLDLALEDVLDPAWVTVIEWGEAVRDLIPPPFLWIEVGYAGEDMRELSIGGVGQNWADRWPEVTDALA